MSTVSNLSVGFRERFSSICAKIILVGIRSKESLATCLSEEDLSFLFFLDVYHQVDVFGELSLLVHESILPSIYQAYKENHVAPSEDVDHANRLTDLAKKARRRFLEIHHSNGTKLLCRSRLLRFRYLARKAGIPHEFFVDEVDMPFFAEMVLKRRSNDLAQ